MYYRLKHLIFPAAVPCRVTLEPVFPVTVNPAEAYSVQLLPLSGLRVYGLRHSAHAPKCEDAELFTGRQKLQVKNGTLYMDITFPQEDRYRLNVFAGETQVETLELYALEQDLFPLTPYKGDNHMHSSMSDGTASPLWVAAASCNLGYDYCVITDHKRFEPSLTARDFFKPTGVDFLVIPGEEVHSPDNPVHLINIGGRESVNDWWRNREDEYRAAVEKELEHTPEQMLPGDRYAAAASQVMFDRIRSVGGVSVLCHPYWIIPTGFNETQDITDYLLENKRFDALELIAGGAYEAGTQMQVSYYHDLPSMPILGSSDSHGYIATKLQPGNYTIVFSASGLTQEGIMQGILDAHTVAGCGRKLYGDYRLVKYAYFLLDNFYPMHTPVRTAQGHGMMRYASAPENEREKFIDKFVPLRPSELFDPLRYREE